MVLKVYMSSVSGNKEIKRKQDFVISILESKKIPFEQIDISDPTKEEDKKFMQKHGQPSGNDKVPMPPQIFSDGNYCGDYEGFHEANEINELETFLKVI